MRTTVLVLTLLLLGIAAAPTVAAEDGDSLVDGWFDAVRRTWTDLITSVFPAGVDRDGDHTSTGAESEMVPLADPNGVDQNGDDPTQGGDPEMVPLADPSG